MIETKTALFNQVLTRLGEKRINSADETGGSAVVLRDEYQQCVDQLLSEYPFLCATRRADLAQASGDNPTHYEYMFQLPKDCLEVQGLVENEGNTLVPFDCLIEGDKLYCNMLDVSIKYTKRIDFNEMSTLVAEALVLLLAHKSAWRITQSVDIENDMYQRYVMALADAVNADGKTRAHQHNSTLNPRDNWWYAG